MRELLRIYILHLVLANATSEVDVPVTRSLVGGPRFSANTGPQWVDYPAYSLSLPPATPVMGTGGGFGGGKKEKSKKSGNVGFAPPMMGPSPLFDILVEPEYIPDPFPVPYPYPIEQQPPPPAAYHPPPPPPPPPINPRSSPRYKRHQYIERAEAQFVCPREYMQEGANCVKIDQVDVDLGCPEGWKYDSGKCRAMDSFLPDSVCDEGYVPWDDKPECVREVVAPKEMKCPHGYVGTAEGCKKNIESHPNAFCDDAILVNGMCRRKTMSAPLATCPAEFSSNVDPYTCYRESLVSGTLTCATPGQMLNSMNVCERRTIKAPQIVCPGGFQLLANECVQEIREDPTPFCENGELHSNGLCLVVSLETPPDLLCDIGAKLNPQTLECEMIVEVPTERTCPNTHTMDPIHPTCIIKVGLIKDKKKSNLSTHLPVVVSCPPGFELSGEANCTRLEILEPVASCPPPFVAYGHQCAKSLHSAPSLLCPLGTELKEGSCTHLEVTGPKMLCLPGFVLTEHGTCLLVENSPSISKCPGGYENSLDGINCQKLEKIDAELLCPPTTVLARDHHTSGPVCKGEEVFDPQFSCGVSGMSLEFTPAGPLCRGTKVEAPVFVCPATFKEEFSRCLKYEVTPKRALCPEGYAFSFNICLKEVEQLPVLLCPEGYSHHQPSETCVRKRFTDLMPLCPNGMQFDRLVGECYVLKVDYEFDEEPPRPEEALKDLSSPTPPPPLEAEKDLAVPSPLPASPPALAPIALPAPQLTIVQQPVVIPQPAIILPQQAPVPPPPIIRVPYGVPQPVPTPVQPKHQHIIQHVVHQTDVLQVPDAHMQMQGKVKGKHI